MTNEQLIDKIAKKYIVKCTNEKLFTNGKLTPTYFRLRHFFMNKIKCNYSYLYDYAQSLRYRSHMTLTQFIQKGEEYGRTKKQQ